jgi:hypothetical protein
MEPEFKVVRKKGQPPQVEVRWNYKSANILLVVGLDGYSHRHYTPESKWSSTVGKNVHLAMNGPLMLDFREMGELLNELSQAVNHAKKKLEQLT